MQTKAKTDLEHKKEQQEVKVQAYMEVISLVQRRYTEMEQQQEQEQELQ